MTISQLVAFFQYAAMFCLILLPAPPNHIPLLFLLMKGPDLGTSAFVVTELVKAQTNEKL